MSEINIKIDVLENAINELKSVKQECDATKKTPPETVGGGKTVNELEEIGKLYQKMNEHVSLMFESTILFLQKTKDGFEKDDQDAASKISKR